MRTTYQKGAETSDEYEQEPGAGPLKVPVTPHWNAIGGLVAIGVLNALLPQKISFGPYGILLLAIEAVFLLPFVFVVITRRSVSPVTLRVGSIILLGIVTFVIAIGIVHMVSTLKKELNGFGLLYTGLLLYGCNILTFALWYWEIDGGGPEKRRQPAHRLSDFLFPQQMGGLAENWVPHFFDDLSVAFTGATAFSPTDTMPLSQRAKFLMMVEAILACSFFRLLSLAPSTVFEGERGMVMFLTRGVRLQRERSVIHHVFDGRHGTTLSTGTLVYYYLERASCLASRAPAPFTYQGTNIELAGVDHFDVIDPQC